MALVHEHVDLSRTLTALFANEEAARQEFAAASAALDLCRSATKDCQARLGMTKEALDLVARRDTIAADVVMQMIRTQGGRA